MKYTLGEEVDGWCVVLRDGEPTQAKARPGVVFGDGCRIYGGWFHDGLFCGGRFHDGWLPLQIQGSVHLVNIPDGKRIRIGCEEHTPEHWAANYQDIGRSAGYTPEQIEEYKRYIDLATAVISDAEDAATDRLWFKIREKRS